MKQSTLWGAVHCVMMIVCAITTVLATCTGANLTIALIGVTCAVGAPFAYLESARAQEEELFKSEREELDYFFGENM